MTTFPTPEDIEKAAKAIDPKAFILCKEMLFDEKAKYRAPQKVARRNARRALTAIASDWIERAAKVAEIDQVYIIAKNKIAAAIRKMGGENG